eukprot:1161619-Pelagomonas_calceolata.AAC.3
MVANALHSVATASGKWGDQRHFALMAMAVASGAMASGKSGDQGHFALMAMAVASGLTQGTHFDRQQLLNGDGRV